MRVLVAGGCGFVGAAICRYLVEHVGNLLVVAFDNLRRAGSEGNCAQLRRAGVQVIHGDIRCQSDVDAMGDCDWVIDAAAEASVLAGTSAMLGRGVTSRQLIEHNLLGTVNLLEAAARSRAGIVLLSTSRVYSIPRLSALPLVERDDAYHLQSSDALPPSVGEGGVTEDFSTMGPVSLYGATKLASESLAIEYAARMDLPLFINRCGVLAGAGQFGKADQGIFSWWIHSWAARRSLSYIGFGGRGLQVRDCLHPADLSRLVVRQIQSATRGETTLLNVSGGQASATSLAQLSTWCKSHLGDQHVSSSDQNRPYDLPWIVLDHTKSTRMYAWQPEYTAEAIFEEIAVHARQNADWLDRTGG